MNKVQGLQHCHGCCLIAGIWQGEPDLQLSLLCVAVCCFAAAVPVICRPARCLHRPVQHEQSTASPGGQDGDDDDDGVYTEVPQCNKPEPPELADQGIGQSCRIWGSGRPSPPPMIIPGPTPRPTRLQEQSAASLAFFPTRVTDTLWAHVLGEQTACARGKLNIGAAHVAHALLTQT
jgi:hypothetical protein